MTFGTPATNAAPTKEERIAAIDNQIAKLQQRKEDIINGVVRTPTKKVKALPAVGSTIYFQHGRSTSDGGRFTRAGVVLATKEASTENGKHIAARVKVQYGEGLDTEVALIYPAQIVEATTTTETSA